jgi:hypothetical protein
MSVVGGMVMGGAVRLSAMGAQRSCCAIDLKEIRARWQGAGQKIARHRRAKRSRGICEISQRGPQ